jgi:hypothetical protein
MIALELRPGVVQHNFDDHRAFLQALHPLSGLWGDTPGEWIFRGQSVADWPLLPTAHRSDAWKPLTTILAKAFQPERADDMQRAKREYGLLCEFFRAADEAGLHVPDYSMADLLLFSGVAGMRTDEHNLWPAFNLIPVLALAQHHGIPTRLLDWTRRGRNAAYFAALPPRDEPKADSDLSVWALNTSLIEQWGASFNPAICRIATAPRSSNANLHAQSGLFTYCQWRDETAALAPLDELVSAAVQTLQHVTKSKDALPVVMRKFTLSRASARDLLRLVHIDGVSGLTMFPGFSGVTRHVQELAWCGGSTLGTPKDGSTSEAPPSGEEEDNDA